MTPTSRDTWGGSLHQTFRLLPEPSAHLRPFLDADGLDQSQVLQSLPYDASRSGGASTAPDPRRYRDGKQVYQTAGLLFEGEDGLVHITALGRATRRWLDIMNDKNIVILARHAAYALAAAQLRNPTGAGRSYKDSLVVFPFSFIWRAMLELDRRINSDELNRTLFRVTDEASLNGAIVTIRKAREEADVSLLGDETVTGSNKNDRIIPWIALASFGWTLVANKDGSGYYSIPDRTLPMVTEAAKVRHRHRDFASVPEYVEYLSFSAALPEDLR